VLRPLIAPLVGVPEWRTPTVFEALVKTIIEQQIAWVTALRAQKWLVEWAGGRIDYDDTPFYAFPTPARLASASLDDLKPLKITFKRMQLLIDIAQQIDSGALDLEAWISLPPEAAYERLLAIKGIGHWTAAVTLERAFGHKNWVAYNDVVLQAAVNRYFLDRVGRVTPAQVMDTFGPHGAFAGLAAHYTMLRWVLDVYPPAGNHT
jgi:DNA-3-methyladenine glycosylase II